ncbi:DUF6362 family protein [Roseibium alexandrii]|uniref:DUF6362 family protein n=1 Tax=Roseibium alexandrii TaxID=388408 RepID=UPI0037538ADE
MTLAELESLILDRLLEAQVCMRSLDARGVRPSTTTTWWPEIGLSYHEWFKMTVQQLADKIPIDDKVKQRPPRPSAAAISRMEETWGWLAGIRNENARKAVAIKVFAWVHKESTSTLARNMGINRVTLNRRYNAGMEELMTRFCKTSVLPDPADEDLVHHFRPNQAMSNRNIAASAA